MKRILITLALAGLTGCAPCYVPPDYRGEYRREHGHPSTDLKHACEEFVAARSDFNRHIGDDDGDRRFDRLYNDEWRMEDAMKYGTNH